MSAPLTPGERFLARVCEAWDDLPFGPVPLPGVQVALDDAGLVRHGELTAKGKRLVRRLRTERETTKS